MKACMCETMIARVLTLKECPRHLRITRIIEAAIRKVMVNWKDSKEEGVVSKVTQRNVVHQEL